MIKTNISLFGNLDYFFYHDSQEMADAFVSVFQDSDLYNQDHIISYEEVPGIPENELSHAMFFHRWTLNKTDWYVIRSLESSVPVPADITALREYCRSSIT